MAKKKAKKRAARKPTSKPTKAAKRKPSAKRKPGRPKASEKVVNPEVLETIAGYWLKGYSLRNIGKAVGLHFTTVRDHLKRSVKPLWRKAMLDELQADLNRMRMMEKRAWRHRLGGRPELRVAQRTGV